MKKIILIIATGLSLAIFAAPVHAADRAQTIDQSRDMQRTMMQDPQRMMVMAYKTNLDTFANILKNLMHRINYADNNFAKEAVDEMKRSLKQMEIHHDKHVKTIPEATRKKMQGMIQQTDNGLLAIKQNLDALDKEVTANNPDPNKSMVDIDQIIKQSEMLPIDGIGDKGKRK